MRRYAAQPMLHFGIAPARALPVMLAMLVAGCGGGGGGAGGETAAPVIALPGSRVSAASPVAAGCTGGSTTGTLYVDAEVEPMLARQPADGRQWVAVWQQDRWSDGGARAVVSAVTRDGGATWQRTLHPFSRCGGAASGSSGDFERVSDPWVDIGADGVVHLLALAFSGREFTATGVTALLASRSTDGGRSYSAPQVLLADPGAAFFNDKGAITVDTLAPRFVYAVWDRLDAAGNGPTWMARSTDGGASWEPAREIHLPTAGGGGTSQTIGNRILVLPAGPDAGTLVNVFTQIDTGSGVANRVRVIRSGDHGLTWGPPITVAEHRGVGTTDAPSGKAVRDGSVLPSAAVAPDGTLWVAWQDSRFSGGVRDAIAVSRSDDGGRSWSVPRAANADLGVAAFVPTLAVRDDGRLGVSYYDLRPNTPAPDTLLAGAWLASTTDGLTWSDTVLWPLFDLAQAPDARGLFLGDYQGLVGNGSAFVSLLALSSTDSANRTDIFDLVVSPASVASSRLSAVAAMPLDAAAEARFQARRQDFTQRVIERRIADWGRRVGLTPVPPVTPP